MRALGWYALALALPGVFLLARMSMDESYGDRPMLVFFVFPIVLSSIVGGVGPGLASTGSCLLLTAYFLLPPQRQFHIDHQYDLVQWAMLAGNGLLVSGLTEVLHRLRRREARRRGEQTKAEILLREAQSKALEEQRAARVEAERLMAEAVAAKNRAEEASGALRRSEQRLILAQEGGHVGIWEVDLKTHETYWSPECERLYGVRPGDPRSPQDWRSRVELEDLARIDEIWAQQSSSGRPVECEFRIRRDDGEIRWMYAVVSARRDEHGVPVSMSGINLDITERKQALEAVRRSEAKYRLLFESSRDPILTLEPPDWRFTAANPAAVAAFRGKSEADVLSKHPSELSPGTQPDGTDSRAKAKAMIEQALHDGTNYFEWTHRGVDGSIFPATVHLTPFELDGRVVLHATVRDVSEQQRAQQRQVRLATAVEQAGEAIVITDARGLIEYVNPAFERITGWRSSEVIGQTPRVLKGGKEDPAFYENLWQTIRRGEVWVGRFTNKRKDGTLYEEEGTISPLRDTAGKIVNYVAVKRDITKEARLEGELRQAQKLEAIGQLAGGVAHDFNNILAVILMQCEVAASVEMSPDVKEAMGEIRDAAKRAANLTRQLLLFSRRQAMQTRELDLNDVVPNLAKMLGRVIGEDIRLQIELGPGPLTIRADAGMIDQVLLNLAVNARDAMPRGGKLRIETRRLELTEAEADAKPGPYVCLSVSDEGVGIPPEILPRIFEPFFTTKEPGKGTGLGLATVFGIVKQHAGAVLVDSELNKGSRFRVLLPSVEPGLVEVMAGGRVRRRGTETILLVEDEPSVRKLTRVFLERNGYKVFDAPHALEALRLFELRQPIHLLLTDIVMPEGVSGLELASLLKARDPALKVIFVSGYSTEISGIDLDPKTVLLRKPCPPEEMLESVRDALDGR